MFRFSTLYPAPKYPEPPAIKADTVEPMPESTIFDGLVKDLDGDSRREFSVDSATKPDDTGEQPEPAPELPPCPVIGEPCKALAVYPDRPGVWCAYDAAFRFKYGKPKPIHRGSSCPKTAPQLREV